MTKPRVYLLFRIVAAYFFIPSCHTIPCLILSSLPLSQLSGHLLCSQISSPCFPVLYYYSIPCAFLCIIILCHPYSCRISLFLLDSLYGGAPISGECDRDSLVKKGGNTQIFEDESIGKRRTKEHLTKMEDKLTMFTLTLLHVRRFSCIFEFVCLLSKYKDVDAIWSKNSCLDTHPITI